MLCISRICFSVSGGLDVVKRSFCKVDPAGTAKRFYSSGYWSAFERQDDGVLSETVL